MLKKLPPLAPPRLRRAAKVPLLVRRHAVAHLDHDAEAEAGEEREDEEDGDDALPRAFAALRKLKRKVRAISGSKRLRKMAESFCRIQDHSCS